MGTASLPFSPLGAEQALPGYRGARGAVLLELKREPGLTIRGLMQRLGLSASAVRHHLRELEAEGLVEHRRQRHGVGAPSHAYHLAPAAEPLFPTGYADTLTALLDGVEAREGREAVVALLERHLGALIPAAESGAPGERMARLAELRTAQGYMAEGAAGPCCGTLVEHHCPIRAVAERFPEVCAAEQRVVALALGGSVERRRHLLAGDGACEYHVRFADGARGPDNGTT
jgi:DeoR family suf operon transcriptional repressor